jgi:hypothetical protein
MARPIQPIFYAMLVLSTVISITASPISGDVCLPLGIESGRILDLFDAPAVTEVVPYFTSSITSLPSAGVYTIGSGYSPATTVTCDGPTELAITDIAIKQPLTSVQRLHRLPPLIGTTAKVVRRRLHVAGALLLLHRQLPVQSQPQLRIPRQRAAPLHRHLP